MSETISIDLSTELADLVRHQVETGVFASQSAVVEEALRLLHDRAERLAALKASLDEAAEDQEPMPAAKLRKHFRATLRGARDEIEWRISSMRGGN